MGEIRCLPFQLNSKVMPHVVNLRFEPVNQAARGIGYWVSFVKERVVEMSIELCQILFLCMMQHCRYVWR